MDKTFPHLSLVWMVQNFFHNSNNLVKFYFFFIQKGAEFVFFFFPFSLIEFEVFQYQVYCVDFYLTGPSKIRENLQNGNISCSSAKTECDPA